MIKQALHFIASNAICISFAYLVHLNTHLSTHSAIILLFTMLFTIFFVHSSLLWSLVFYRIFHTNVKLFFSNGYYFSENMFVQPRSICHGNVCICFAKPNHFVKHSVFYMSIATRVDIRLAFPLLQIIVVVLLVFYN